MTRKPLNRGKLGGIRDAMDSSLAPQPQAELPAQESAKDWINMNFKAERAHRRHWKAEAARRGEDISSQLRAFLTERYGLPHDD